MLLADVDVATIVKMLQQHCSIYKIFSANSENSSVHHSKQIKFSNKFMLITLISCILLSSCVNYCEARPNLSTGANNGVDGIDSSNVSIFFYI